MQNGKPISVGLSMRGWKCMNMWPQVSSAETRKHWMLRGPN